MKPPEKKQTITPAGQGDAIRCSPTSDADLVRAAWRGDKQAFVEIVARNQAMVCSIALSIVGDFAASEDVAQEAFLNAWRKIHELREPEKLGGWLRQIVRRAALGYCRRHQRHDALEDAPDLPDCSPGPGERAASAEESALVQNALMRLPELYREPLILYYREHQSAKVVAEALEISEDAVRQRLARGRELLRDQVAGVIEGVLTRTRPTTFFTMTIAVAIGALASPAAVASTVFAVAASGAASSTNTPAPFLKALNASRHFLGLAAVVTVICIPVGYQLRLRAELREVRAVAKEPSVPTPPLPASAPNRNSAIFAEWKRLHDTHGTNTQAMPLIYAEIARLSDSLRRQGFRAALIAEWVQLSATNAMARFGNRTIDVSQRRQFVEEWIALDAATAVEVLMASGRGGEAIVRTSLPELARRAPERVASVVTRLPGPENSRDRLVQEAFAIVAEWGIDSTRATAESIPGPNRDQALAGVAQAWGKRDLAGAIAWAKELPNGTDRDEVIRSAIVGSAAVAPLLALDHVGLTPPGGRKGYFGSTLGARVLHEAAAVDFDGTVGWLAAHPGRLGIDDLMGLASAVGEKLNAGPLGFLTQLSAAGWLAALRPALNHALAKESSGQRRAVWDWLNEQPEDATIRELREHLLRTVGAQDIPMALRMGENAPPTDEGDTQLRLLADGLLGHGSMLHRLPRLLEGASQRLRPILVETAFTRLNVETLGDPPMWAERLSLLPDAARVRATESFARAWAGRTPEEAMAWADGMVPGAARVAAVSAIAATWAAKDAPAAATRIAAMPPGPERDRSAEALVVAMAEEFPREAWGWALSIEDAEGRTRAAAYAAKAMAAQDSTGALAWIENSPLPIDAKAAIQSALVNTP